MSVGPVGLRASRRVGALSRPVLSLLVTGLVMGLVTSVAGCTAAPDAARSSAGEQASTSPSAKPTPAVRITANVSATEPVAVDEVVEVRAEGGTLERVQVVSPDAAVHGALSSDQTTWTASERLEPGVSYTIQAVAVDADGRSRRTRRTFESQDLSLDQQTYPSIAPLAGETVGVGMPVIISFDVPVTDRAAIQRHLSVETSPQQVGAWDWISDNEVHWRPRTYWQPGTEVTINADINSVSAGNGVYGQLSRSTSFSVGDAVILNVDVARHMMQVKRNGTLLRSIPISAGKPGFTTRSGIKVIIEKFREKRMDAATTGISKDDPEYYNIDHVEYAQRVTYSGEFLHAAPWSVGSQGSANVSHGCVGMSTENAAWLYRLTKRGDVVDVTGSDRYMTLTNGYGDWNLPFSEYKAG